MAYRVLNNGAMIEVVDGSRQLPNGGTREVTRTFIAREGQIIEQELSADLKRRYDEGEAYARSLVERVAVTTNEDGDQVVSVVGASTDESETPQTDEALVARNAELTETNTNLENELAQARSQIAELETQVQEASNDDSEAQISALQSQVTELQQQLDEATAPSGDAAGGQYDPSQYNVDEVLQYLSTASAEEVERVKAAEAQTDRNSTQIAGFQGGSGS